MQARPPGCRAALGLFRWVDVSRVLRHRHGRHLLARVLRPCRAEAIPAATACRDTSGNAVRAIWQTPTPTVTVFSRLSEEAAVLI